MREQFALAVVLSAVSIFPAGPGVKTIIQRSVAANQKDWQASPEYSYVERDQNDGNTKTYRVLMLEGSPYNYLLEVNGEPLSPEDQETEREKLQQAIEERRNETPQQREERIRQYQKERRRDHLLMEQLADAFDFTLKGEQKLDGFDVYVLSAKPRPGYQPPNTEAEALTGMQGKLWIDKKTYQWVKVEAEVVHPVSVEGFLARIEPGTRFELEKIPVADDIWLAKHFAMKSRAKILFFFSRNRQEHETYWDYQKGSATQNIGKLPPKPPSVQD
jgi:hypothetical protein